MDKLISIDASGIFVSRVAWENISQININLKNDAGNIKPERKQFLGRKTPLTPISEGQGTAEFRHFSFKNAHMLVARHSKKCVMKFQHGSTLGGNFGLNAADSLFISNITSTNTGNYF
jgi:hypothetical protein